MSPLDLSYQEDIIDTDFEKEIVTWLDQQNWSTTLKRRTQQYGYEYNYSSRSTSTPTTPISGPLKVISDWLKDNEVLDATQCIVNEYYQTQGISAHTDSNKFGPVVVSVSLLEPCNMIFTKPGQTLVKMCLMPRSVLILSGESRYEWKHEIKGLKNVTMGDGSVYSKPDTYRRISLTYRTVA